MSQHAIQVEGLSKRYRLGGLTSINRTFREMISEQAGALFSRTRNGSNRREDVNAEKAAADFWALRDVSFNVEPGECVGVIGRNGAGKSTLLKILSRITDPTAGHADIRGRVSSLLEVGTGFHAELSGRENIYLNGSILGMRRAEIDRKFDEIVDFAGVEKFLDTPVKRYSSGMTVRLAFAVAAHLEPEIMLVDEVLAVGDAGFQRKCLGKMSEAANSDRTILFVSHNMAAVSKLCKRSILIDGGQVVADGPSDDIIRQYFQCLEQSRASDIRERADRRGTGTVRIEKLRMVDARSHDPINSAVSGQSVRIEVDYVRTDGQSMPLRNVNMGLAVMNDLGQFVTAWNSQMSSRNFEMLPASGSITCEIPRLALMYGQFNLNATLFVEGELVDQVEHAAELTVESGDYYGTGRPHRSQHPGVYMDHAWHEGIAAESSLPRAA